MATDGPSTEDALRQVQDYYERTARQVERERQALRSLHGLLLDISRQSLQLHQRSASVLDAINRDLEKVKRQLKRISTART